MVDLITLQTVSIMIAATTVVIGVINSIISGRREEKQRQEQLILQRFQGLSREYFQAFANVMAALDWENVDEFWKKYDRSVNPEFNAKFVYVMYTYNLAGISLKRGSNPDLIFQLYSPNSTVNLWEQYEPVIEAIRELTNYPKWLDPFEFLYKEAKKRYPEIRRRGFDVDSSRFRNR